jgi:hypothetical protein
MNPFGHTAEVGSSAPSAVSLADQERRRPNFIRIKSEPKLDADKGSMFDAV